MSDIINKIRGISSTINTLSNFKRIGRDFFRNLAEQGVQDIRSESLTPENFILYLPARNLPDSFGVSDGSPLYKVLLTKIGEPLYVMRIRVIDGVPNVAGTNLFLLVNPASIQVSVEKSYSDYITRTGPKAEYSGNKPITLSFDGSSGGFYGLDDAGSGYGVGNFLRTLAFKNILSIVTFYKSNGFVYGDLPLMGDAKTFSVTRKGDAIKRQKDVRRVNLIEITYRDTVYLGSFFSMSLTYSSSSPSKIAYSFTFTAYRHVMVNL